MAVRKYLIIVLSIILLHLFNAGNLKTQHIEVLQQGKAVSIRGLSVVNDKVAWVSSSKGYVAITTDSGKNWEWLQVKGFEKADFRDIDAFSDKEAVIMSSGTPALVLKTVDGGVNWKVNYRNTDTAYFLDAMDFVDARHGYILGDPIDGKFVLLETKNGGETWTMLNNRPNALPGEAAFAASGTCLRVDKKKLSIVTGGTVARCLTTELADKAWKFIELPLAHGIPSKGAFSIAGDGRVIVGGDYSKDKLTDSVVVIFNNATSGFSVNKPGLSGYQSCVEYINDKKYISTGTSGTNISMDKGLTWVNIDTKSYNVCRKAKSGKLVLLAGDGGKIAILQL